MGVIYLAALAISLTGMVVLDRRFGLFFWRDARRAGIVYAVGMVFFLVWDLVGISAGVFFRGETSVLTGILVAPEVPLEELFFLSLLIYSAMNLFGAGTVLASRRRAAQWGSGKR